MDTAQWPQGILDAKPGEKKPRPQKEHALNCPRCSSSNTKFCYYNNYSLSQPRYFCKTCRRYWTQGGSLRNVPVGGGSRKNRRSSSSSSSSSSLPSAKKGPSLGPENSGDQNPRMIPEGQDLNLAYDPPLYNMGFSEFVTFDPQNPSFAAAANQFPITEVSKAGNFLGPNPVYDLAGGFHCFKQGLGFPGDGLEMNGFGFLRGVEDNHANSSSSRNFFLPFGDHLKHAVANGDQQFEHGKGEATGFWSGMLAGGSPPR